MKALGKTTMGFFLILGLLFLSHPLQAQDSDDENYFTVSGVVKDSRTKKKLDYVNVSVPGTNIGTVTNAEGEFSIKIKESLDASRIEVSFIGYRSSFFPVNGEDISNVEVLITPSMTMLEEVVVRAQDPRYLVLQAMDKIADNYSPTSILQTGFYRETIQKGRRYINVSEAIVDIYKTPYTQTVECDRVQIYKGRSLLSIKASDTLAVKILGGPNLSVYVDMVKNPDLLLDPEVLPYYAFRMEETVMIDDRPQYVISFQPQAILPYPLYYGKLYIDKETLAFSRAEFSLSMDDTNKATQAILMKKPFTLRFKPEEVSFVVTYTQRDNLSYLTYIKNQVRFKCDWKRKLFSTNYTILAEMVITDSKTSEVEAIPLRASFRSNHSLSDKVGDFSDPDFWGAYNIIEPTESLESAVNKLKKQQR